MKIKSATVDHARWTDPQSVMNAIDYVENAGGCHPTNRVTWETVIVPGARAALRLDRSHNDVSSI